MATSIRDLLHTLESEAPYAAGTPRQVRDASGSLAELGRALRQLGRDGLELTIGGTREEVVNDLAESCAQVAAGVDREPFGRLTALAGAAADVVATLRNEVGRDQRWAITLELAATVQVVSTYAAEGDRRRTADLAWAHLTARALVNRGPADPPAQESLAILDRAVPRSMLPAGALASRAAMESMVLITDRLRRSATDLTRRPTLLEVFAVSRAAESTTRYGTAAAAALNGRATPEALPASAIWHEVRDRLRPFTSAAPLRVEDRDLGLWAQRAHLELRREFGPPGQPRLTGDRGPGLKVDAVLHLQAMVNEIPDVANHLARVITQLADHSELHALASRLPFREQRVSEFLTHRPVVADRFDVVTIVDRLDDAAKLAAELAVELDRAASRTVGRAQPGAIAAREARLQRSPLDPHAALVNNIVAGMGGPEPGAAELSAPEPDPRSPEIDAEADTGPAWDIE